MLLFVIDNAGRPLEANPLRDLRVRKAILMALSREAVQGRDQRWPPIRRSAS